MASDGRGALGGGELGWNSLQDEPGEQTNLNTAWIGRVTDCVRRSSRSVWSLTLDDRVPPVWNRGCSNSHPEYRLRPGGGHSDAYSAVYRLRPRACLGGDVRGSALVEHGRQDW